MTRAPEKLPTPRELRETFSYDRASGRLFRRRYPGVPINSEYANFRDTSLQVRRVIWALHYNEWPPANCIVEYIITGSTVDNHIHNLRLITKSDSARKSWEWKQVSDKTNFIIEEND